MSDENVAVIASSEEDDAKRLGHYDEIQEQAKVVRLAARRWSVLKESCTGAKKKWEAESARLVEIVNGDPFEEYSEPDEPAEECTSVDWQNQEIDALADHDVSPKQIGCLLDAGLKTLGHLQRLMTSEGTFWSSEVKGIGEAAQTKIEDALNYIVCAAQISTEDVIDPSFVVVPDEQIFEQTVPNETGVDISDV